jgi:hypothetical protein
MKRMQLAAIVVLVVVSSALGAIGSKSVVALTEGGVNRLTIQADLPSALALAADPDFGGESVMYLDDQNAVPAVTRWIAVPAGTLPKLSVASRETRPVDANGSPTSPIDASDYSRPDLSPAAPAIVGLVEVYRGVPIAPVTFYPLQLAGDGSGVENRTLEVNIEFHPDAAAPNVNRINDLAGSMAARTLDRMLLNPPQRDPGEDLERLLILYPAGINRAQGIVWVDSLANWKRRMGYDVTVLAIDLQQNDPITIRQMIRNNYYFVDHPLSHLLIIGGDSANQAIVFPTCPGTGGRTGDHFYGLMDNGDNYLTDITVGRMYAMSYTQLQGAIKRSILYESSPYLDGGETWFHQALYTAENIAAPGGQFVPSMMQLGRWIWHRWTEMGYNPIDTLYTGLDQMEDVNAEVRRILEQEGISIAISRGWLAGCITNAQAHQVVNTGRRNPLVMAITCLSRDTQIDFFSRTEINTMTGPIASMAMWNLTRTKTNNCLMSGAVRAMRDYNLHRPGDILNYSKVQLWGDYSMVQDVYGEMLNLVAECRLMGDPTVDVYTDTPTRIATAHPETLVPGATAFEMQVEADGGPLEDLKVCIWPAGGNQMVVRPDEDGNVRFTIPEGLPAGPMKLTITGHNRIAYTTSIPVQAPAAGLIVSDVSIQGPHQELRAGDEIQVTLAIRNPGQNQVNNPRLIVSSTSPWVTFASDTVDLASIAGNGSRETTLNIQIDPSTPNGEYVRTGVMLSSGDARWPNAFEFQVTSPDLYKANIIFVGGDVFDRGRSVRFQPDLRNAGEIPSVAVNARLVSLDTLRYTVVGAAASYGAANAGGGQAAINGQFRVNVSQIAVPGTEAPFRLELSTQNGSYRDTIEFTIPVGARGRQTTDPLGPDQYGYLCFDSFDEGWAKRPTYSWREINPHKEDRDFDGTRVDLRDYRVDFDSSTAVGLPFPFQYYGESFDTIIVCSNGWIAFGAEKSLFIDFRNTRIPGVLGPDAMVAAYWDDLINPVPFNRGIFTHFVEEEGIFIIEYSELSAYADNYGNLQEFQIILYDPERRPTTTGDGEILIQYKHIVAAEGHDTDNKFATVGIRNLDGTDGIEYTYWDQYAPGARRLEDRMALLFTPDAELLAGVVQGTVSLFENPNQSMEGVAVTLPGASSAVTNAQGAFRIEGVPVGQYLVSFAKRGYNESHVAITVQKDSTVVANARLTHPTPNVPNRQVTAGLEPGDNRGPVPLRIENSGNGDLEFRLSRRYENGTLPTTPQLLGVSITRHAQSVDNSNFQGIEMVGDTFYVTYSGSGVNRNDNTIMMFDRNGGLIDQFPQPSRTAIGFRDLAYDGSHFYGGEDSMVVKFDRYGNLVDEIRVPVWDDTTDFDLKHPAALAWNPEHETLMMAYYNSVVYEMTPEGAVIDSFRMSFPRMISNIWGLAWNPADDDGMPLYAIHQTSPDGRHMWLTKASNDAVKGVRQLAASNNEYGRGLAIGFDYTRFKAIGAVISYEGNSLDSLKVFELGPDTRGITFDRSIQTVEPNSGMDFWMTFKSLGLAATTYRFGLVLLHNALQDSILIPVELRIRDGEGVGGSDLLPESFSLEEPYPNPFNSSTRINFTIPATGEMILRVYDIAGREVARLVEGEIEAGSHTVAWSPQHLGSGLYFARLEMGGHKLVTRLVLLK